MPRLYVEIISGRDDPRRLYESLTTFGIKKSKDEADLRAESAVTIAR